MEASAPWWPGLAQKLANQKWIELNTKYYLNIQNYSTTRFVFGQGHKPRSLLSIAGLPRKSDYLPPKIEVLPTQLEACFAGHGLRFYRPDEISDAAFSSALRVAYERISVAPGLFESVTVLARCIVLLRPEVDTSDISYSSPEIPFTIFVSIPCNHVENLGLRVAEAVVHECMHLQLTLLNEVQPLVQSDSEVHFSPWKGELRASSGILHALYVFAAIKRWLQLLPSNERDQTYVSSRISQITDEASQLYDFGLSTDLTPFGKNVCKQLLHYLRADCAI